MGEYYSDPIFFFSQGSSIYDFHVEVGGGGVKKYSSGLRMDVDA